MHAAWNTFASPSVHLIVLKKPDDDGPLVLTIALIVIVVLALAGVVGIFWWLEHTS